MSDVLYISGGMTGHPEFNFPMFDEVEEACVDTFPGCLTYSPAQNDRDELLKRGIHDITKVPGYAEGDVSRYNESIGDTEDLLRWDFNAITNHCTGIVMLPGWEQSTGARWERTVAEALGLQVWLANRSTHGARMDHQPLPLRSWYFTLDSDQQRLTKLLKDAVTAAPQAGSLYEADCAAAALDWRPEFERIAQQSRDWYKNVSHMPDPYAARQAAAEAINVGINPFQNTSPEVVLNGLLGKGEVTITALPAGRQERKDLPIATGVLDYFPDALVEVSRVSKIGNDQHNPGEPLHWAKEKSTDEGDALIRHFLERGTIDTDGTRHSAKVAWRALALLQREIDEGNA